MYGRLREHVTTQPAILAGRCADNLGVDSEELLSVVDCLIRRDREDGFGAGPWDEAAAEFRAWHRAARVLATADLGRSIGERSYLKRWADFVAMVQD